MRPRQARYQAALRPDGSAPIIRYLPSPVSKLWYEPAPCFFGGTVTPSTVGRASHLRLVGVLWLNDLNCSPRGDNHTKALRSRRPGANMTDGAETLAENTRYSRWRVQPERTTLNRASSHYWRAKFNRCGIFAAHRSPNAGPLGTTRAPEPAKENTVSAHVPAEGTRDS